MNKVDRFEVFLVHNNPQQDQTPRVFLIRKKANRIVWAFEIDEMEEKIMASEFIEDEADFFGTLQSFEGSIASVMVEGSLQDIDFSEKIGWAIETLMMEDRAIVRIPGTDEVSPCRLVPKNKYTANPDWLAAEKQHIARKRASFEGRPQAKHATTGKKAPDQWHDFDTPETEDKYVTKKKKSSGGRKAANY